MLNSINVSSTGLNAAKTAVENVSNNIANENTPGYKKRVVQISELEQMDTRFTGRGVSADSTYRVTSQYMFDKLLDEGTKTNYYDKLSTMLGNVEAIFSETDTSGLSSDLNRYLESVEDLRSDPNSEVFKTTLASNAAALVDTLNNMYTSIERLQVLEKSELNENVDKVNDILQEIGVLNEKLGQLSEASNDLLDKRDQLETELSKYVDIEVDRTDGDYELKIAGVVAVRYNTNVRDVSVSTENINQIDSYTNIQPQINAPDIVYDAIKYNDSYQARTFAKDDTVTYKINNEIEISVIIGGTQFIDQNGNKVDIDLDEDGTPDEVTADNVTRALVYAINHHSEAKDLVTAYNGERALTNGVLTTDDSKDNYLRIESNVAGLDGAFEGRISVTTALDGRDAEYKNDYQSTEPEDRVFLTVYGEEVDLKNGMIKAQTENLSSEDYKNKYQSYLDQLDAFARTLADLSDSYIQTGTDEYIYGEAASDASLGTINKIGLFSGSSVKNLVFDKNAINDLSQGDLDYLASLQWKTDISFEEGAQNPNAQEVTSLTQFIQHLKVDVAAHKESNDFLLETQENVEQALQSSYDDLVKVDKDEEMIDLMKFQAAYTANAKVITAIDEMIQVLLGLKR